MSICYPRPVLSVVLPTYNEAPNIVDLARAVRAVLPRPDDEIIVVDDDSPDGTWRLAQEEAASVRGLSVIRRVGRRGLTSALSEGFQAARGDLIGWMDCDFSTPPELFPVLAAKVAQGCDIAVGSRYAPGGADARAGNPLRRLASLVITRLGSALLVPEFRDLTSGFAVARREVLESIPLRGDYGEYFIDLIVRAHRRGLRLAEVPYAMAPRRAGASKTDEGFALKGARYLATVARLACRL
jgi:dolichol-phosphate mannosyltransferase